MTAGAAAAAARATAGGEEQQQAADVFVVFGITGDLAKVMTFRSLYRLEKRGLLDCPIVGVAVNDWTVEKLRDHARECIEGTGEKVDPAVFDRLAERLSYVEGDFGDAATYARVADAIKGAEHPVFYLEIPPFLFGRVVEGLSEAGLTDHARVVVEKPFGHDMQSARELADELHQYIDESQLYRIDHFLGKMGLVELLFLRFANTMLEPPSFMTGVAGCLLAAQVGVSRAITFQTQDSLTLAATALIGGIFSLWGAVIAGVFNQLLPFLFQAQWGVNANFLRSSSASGCSRCC